MPVWPSQPGYKEVNSCSMGSIPSAIYYTVLRAAHSGSIVNNLGWHILIPLQNLGGGGGGGGTYNVYV